VRILGDAIEIRTEYLWNVNKIRCLMSQPSNNNTEIIIVYLYIRFANPVANYEIGTKVEVEVDSQSVSQSACLGIEYPYGTCHQILFLVGMLLSEICGLVSVGRPL
jgi:hypothetical protein